MTKLKKKRNEAEKDTGEMLREYWETIESESKQREAKNDNVKKSSQNESSGG